MILWEVVISLSDKFYWSKFKDKIPNYFKLGITN